MSRDVAEAFRDVLGLDDAPATLADWTDETTALLADAEFSLGVESLCVTDASRHEARVGGDTEQFQCVLDALLLPFLVEDSPVRVRSECPATGGVVEMEATTDRVTANPASAVVSLGVATDAGRPDDVTDAVGEFGYAAFCPYVNAFPDETAYEQWNDETTNAAAMALTPAEAHAIAARMAAV